MKPTSRPLQSRVQGRARALLQWLLPTALASACALSLAAPTLPARDRVTLLVPDGASTSAWQVKVWTDTAAEEGVRMDVITDSQLLALGTSAVSKIPGLIVPDSAHIKASDAVIAAIKQYAYNGGKLMLVYDAGVQKETGFFPATGNSRFADMVGVDYVFWNNGAGVDTMVGFGPVVGTKARLDTLSFPPGKYVPYTVPATLAAQTSTTTTFAPASSTDPSASTAMSAMLSQRAAQGIDDGSNSVRAKRLRSLRDLLGIGIESSNVLRFNRRNASATDARSALIFDRITKPASQVKATLTATGAVVETAAVSNTAEDLSPQAISGYGYGALGYFSYVTTGTFPGTVYLSSPDHGLVAGQRTYGSGQLLFVNMPLGYFKALGTDSAPLHGFLGLFARDQVGVATMSVQPRGKGGLIYNWHVDDGDDLNTDVKNLLNQTTVLKRGPFSIHFTAGPDVITPGDGGGMNLPGNAGSRDLVQRLGNLGPYSSILNLNKLPAHELGSHGGWIHDYWGMMASEANLPDLTPLLSQNFNAIEAVTGRKIKEYSSPVGNTPAWAIKWMEDRGVVAMYLVGDLGSGMVRSWRNGARLTNKLWTSPVTPLGKYATFEEFDDFGISDTVSGQWLLDLQSFAVNKRTNRMFYNHPPGAAGHLTPVNALLTRGDTLQSQGKFAWYTMRQLAEFSQRRVETTWSTSTSWGITTFSASNASGLGDQTWLLPKTSYTIPIVTWGLGSVSSDDTNWIVTSNGGTQLNFITLAQ